MTGKLDGKVIVISGGTQGLGEAIARQAVADGAAGLVIAGRSADKGEALAKELSDLGTPTTFVEADMSDAPRRGR
jgi:NAD(P)-dependent dehydrogenase (short-subunit alcohol dehydrogenase family)